MDSNTQHVSFSEHPFPEFTPYPSLIMTNSTPSKSRHRRFHTRRFEPHELIGTPAMNLVHPDEFAQVREMHYHTIRQDKAAVLAYLRMKHKDPCKGYILCSVTRTVCQNVLAGSISFASPGPKAMHNASTAQEVTIITPSAKDFEFRRWNDPNPMPPCLVGETDSESDSDHTPPPPDTSSPIRFAPSPNNPSEPSSSSIVSPNDARSSTVPTTVFSSPPPSWAAVSSISWQSGMKNWSEVGSPLSRDGV
ncbi:hypothetical protein NLI96_g12903 [Meripilus lineatus]|uniref:Uncharacterized protein n=1 Tax=Meripilus lineatus TaxID=2056292 RepID=A0AAD5UP96_9APHY|nr:hypothetical protein NLI96_g12903 [Physisporinus lineatus]